MNNTFFSSHKPGPVTSLLLIAGTFLMAGLIRPDLTSAQEPQQASEKFIRHASARTIANRYIVVLRHDAVSSVARDEAVAEIGDSLAAAYSAQIERTYTHALKGYAMEMSEAQALALSRDQRVAYVEEDAEVSVEPVRSQNNAQENSTENNPTWGLDRIDQRELPLDNRYTYNAAGRGVNVYVIDSGIRRTHQEFQGRAFAAFDAMGDGQNTNDCHGHGTHVAATIGGAVYGAAKDVRLYAVRVFGCSGDSSDSVVIAGVDWVTAHHVKPAVANMSLGGPASQALDDAVKNSIAAGATTSSDGRASFSNYGTCVNIFAPGFAITSAGIANDYATAVMSGTSMATPHVTGAAALYLESNPAATPAAVNRALLDSASANQVSDIGPGSPNLLLFSQFGNNGGAPCTSCEHYTGLMTRTGEAAFEPNGTFYLNNSFGYHKGWLRGPAGADFDLYLWRWDGTQWVVVASAEGSTSTEEISWYGGPGYYIWRVYAWSGKGFYDFWLKQP